MKIIFWINSLRKANESLLQSSISHIITLITLSLSIIKDLRSLLLIFTPKEPTVSETTGSTSVASYLDLLFTRDKSNNIPRIRGPRHKKPCALRASEDEGPLAERNQSLVPMTCKSFYLTSKQQIWQNNSFRSWRAIDWMKIIYFSNLIIQW